MLLSASPRGASFHPPRRIMELKSAVVKRGEPYFLHCQAYNRASSLKLLRDLEPRGDEARSCARRLQAA